VQQNKFFEPEEESNRRVIRYFGAKRENLGWVLSIMPKIPEISVRIQMEGPFRFLLTGIFGITSGGGPLISVGIFRPKFVVPFLTNWFFALIRELRKRNKQWQEPFLLVGPV